MNKRHLIVAGILWALAWPAPAWGRGGGGCLEEGTGILTPAGEVAIERLRAGDAVTAITADGARTAFVRAVVKVEPAEYVELRWPGGQVRVTGEHPLAARAGQFRAAGTVGTGQGLACWREGRAERVEAVSARRVKAGRPAYNLVVWPGGTYVANGLIVHNKGCFLPDTPVLRADGRPAAIREIRKADAVLAFRADGTVTSATVREVLTAEADEYLVVTTERAVLRVTADHPFYVGAGEFRAVGGLRAGDTVYAHDGRGSLAAQRIVEVQRVAGATTVYNLQTDEPHTFFADGVAVHNKGGGCFAAGTPVLTPEGPRAIETLAPGSVVTAIGLDGRARPATVTELLATRRAAWELETDTGRLTLSEDHPLMVGAGEFSAACRVGAGGRVMAWRGGRLASETVRGWRPAGTERTVFNLRVDGPHTFVAGGMVVHNKGGGCFLGDTPVLREDGGSVAIGEVRAGERLLAFREDGAIVATAVRRVVAAEVEGHLAVTTESGVLRVTEDHPFYVGGGRYKAIGAMTAGEEIFVYAAGRLAPERIAAIERVPGRVRVYNLQADEPHTFFAGGAAVHNKGGGGGGFHSSGGHHSGGGRDGDWDSCCSTVVVLVVATVVILKIVSWIRGKPKSEQNLDFVYRPGAVAGKVAKTRKLLEFIARVDEAFAPEALAQQAEATFRKLQECWEGRDYGPMKALMMPDLHAQHCRQIAAMIQQHEIDHLEGLSVDRVEIVNVRYTEKSDQREFTALITASARDYYTDDRTGAFLRGDSGRATFQEFWTFQRQGKAWLLREVEQSRESNALKEENFFEQFTDHGVRQVYGEEADKEGQTGPWLEKGTATKAVKIERLLNFLAATDKLWTRGAMLERARQVFTKVYLCQEAGDPEGVPADDMFPEAAAALKETLAKRRAAGIAVEYRNLCVRKAELILVRNFADNRKDEFTVRISAHAQKTVRSASGVREQDADVAPFEEYWTFGRLEKAWRLKEVLPPAAGQRALEAENLDEDSTPEQLQWYYRQSRAV